MRRRHSKLSGLLVVVSLTVGAACGGDDGDDAAESAPESAESAPEPAESAPEPAESAPEPAESAPDDATGATTSVASANEPSPSSSDDAWAEVVEATLEEGTVNFWTTGTIAPAEALKAAFEQAYPGMNMVVIRDVASGLLPQLELQWDTGAGEADVVFSVDPSIFAGHEEFMATVESPHVADLPTYDASLPYVYISSTAYGLMWNTDLVPDGLESYDDLLDPSLVGLIGVLDPQVPTHADFYMFLEEQFGREYVESLAAQQPSFFVSNLPMTEAVASGEIAAGHTLQQSSDLIDSGAPVGWAFPPGETLALYNYAMISSEAPNPNAAQLLVDFMATPEGQEAIAVDSISPLPDIPGTIDLALDDVSHRDLTRVTQEAFEEYRSVWESIFR